MNNIVNYLFSIDMYYRLWLVAQTKHSDGDTWHRTFRKEHWHPELVDQFKDPSDVPIAISVEGNTHQIDGNGRFHTGNKKPSIEIKKMRISWGAIKSDAPVEITLNAIKMWHHQDHFHRRRGDALIVKTARFNWNTRVGSTSGYYRENGPYQIMLSSVTAKAHTSIKDDEIDTHIYDVGFRSMRTAWSRHDGNLMTSSITDKIIQRNKIKVNYLNAGSSVFEDVGEEFIFWSEVGGNL